MSGKPGTVLLPHALPSAIECGGHPQSGVKRTALKVVLSKLFMVYEILVRAGLLIVVHCWVQMYDESL